MTIAELFVNLGIKGGEKANAAIGGVDKKMQGLASSSVVTKAAIVAAIYAFERMSAAAAQTGSQISMFNSQTGLSSEMLQRWQYAGRQFGVTADEVTSSIKGIQDAVAKMELGGEAPEGLNILANTVGFDVNKARDAFYVAQKIHEFAQKNFDPAQSKTIARSFGVGDNMFGAMRRGAFDPSVLARANVYTDKQAESLRRLNALMENFSFNMSKAFGNLVARHGNEIFGTAGALSKVAEALIKIQEAQLTLQSKLGFFKLFAVIAKEIGESMMTAANALGMITDKIPNGAGAGAIDKMLSWRDNQDKNIGEWLKRTLGGSATEVGARGGSNVTVNQNMQFTGTDPANAQQVGAVHEKAVGQAVRQNPALYQVN